VCIWCMTSAHASIRKVKIEWTRSELIWWVAVSLDRQRIRYNTVGTVYIGTVAKGVTLTNIPLLDHLLAL